MNNCKHENVEYTCETEEWFSNGMFGIPASNRPLATDLVNDRYTCLDCGAIILPNPEGGYSVIHQ